MVFLLSLKFENLGKKTAIYDSDSSEFKLSSRSALNFVYCKIKEGCELGIRYKQGGRYQW